MNREIVPYQDPDRVYQNLILSGRSPSEGEERVNFSALVSTLRRRKWLFRCVAGGIFALAILVTVLMTPLYAGISQVVIDTQDDQLVPQVTTVAQQVVQAQSDISSPAVDTEVQVIMSSEIANKVAEALQLDKYPYFDPALAYPGTRVLLAHYLLGQPIPVSPRVYDPAAQRQYIIDYLKKYLLVTRAGDTFSLTIEFDFPDPQMAAAIANEYAKQYTQQAVERKRQSTREALAFLSKRIEELRKQAQTDTEAVMRYRISHNLLSSNGTQLTEQEVSTYNQELANARADAASDQARLSTAQAQLRNGSNGDDVGEALNSSVVSALKTQQAQLSGDLADLKSRYGPKYPDVINLQQRLADVNKSIAAETNRVISNLNAKQSVSNKRVASMQGSLGAARGTLSMSNRAMAGVDDLSRKAATSQELYESYLNRYKEASAQEGTEKGLARVISWAEVAAYPESPKIILNLFLGLTLGVAVGLIVAFVAELLFSGLTTGEEVEAKLGVPYLGLVPTVSSILKGSTSPLTAVVEHPHSGFTETFRSLKTSIAYGVDSRAQIIVLTSALPKEGKSTIAICLARVSAAEGERVLLVDCDGHRRALNKLIAEPREAGLVEVLQGRAALEDALVQDADSGAWLLPLNRSKLAGDVISGEQMQKLLARLRMDFSYIIIDTAPLLPVADSRVLATYADAVVLIAQWRQTPDHAVKAALKLLPGRPANLAGVALSRVDMKKQSRFGYGDSAYYYNHYAEYYA
jgi:capsular exopolysaccharide synthesis family protein